MKFCANIEYNGAINKYDDSVKLVGYIQQI